MVFTFNIDIKQDFSRNSGGNVIMSLEHPNFFNSQDRQLYYELERQIGTREFTKEEDKFFKTMYHQEEFDAGLDGDR